MTKSALAVQQDDRSFFIRNELLENTNPKSVAGFT